MSTFYDIGTKFESSGAFGLTSEIELDAIVPGVSGTVPNLYRFKFTDGTGWDVYEDDFCVLVTQGLWTPIAAPIPQAFDLLSEFEKMLGEDSEPTGCQHKWKEYHGLIEKYTFCEKCDKRRD